MYYRLTSNFLGSPDWPWTSDSSAYIFLLSLQGYTMSPSWGSGNETPGFLHARQALYSLGCIFGFCICNLEPHGKFPYSPPPPCERYNVWLCFYPISYCFSAHEWAKDPRQCSFSSVTFIAAICFDLCSNLYKVGEKCFLLALCICFITPMRMLAASSWIQLY